MENEQAVQDLPVDPNPGVLGDQLDELNQLDEILAEAEAGDGDGPESLGDDDEDDFGD